MKNIYLYIFAIVLLTAYTSSCSTKKEEDIPALTETFAKADTKPFGTKVAYQQVLAMFNRNYIKDKKTAFDKTWNSISDTGSLYICFTPVLYVNEAETKAMMDYVYAGNSLFIAANYIDDNLLNELKCSENYTAIPYNSFFESMQTTSTVFNDSLFQYYYHPFKNSFKFRDTVFTKVLGVNDFGKPNYIVYFHGKGKLFLHCDAKAFSNYFLLKNDNYKYLQNALAYTNHYPDHIYWDEYYRMLNMRRNNENKSSSSLGAILSKPPLAAAFWLLLLLLLLYIVFGSKRKQRVIEKIKPNENTTVTFTETIGRLYLQKKDNKNIAEKMSTYFNEYIRNNYFLNTNTINDDFITSLSRKSGVDRGKVESLYRAMHHVQNSAVVDDYQLLSLNEQIQTFYKKQ